MSDAESNDNENDRVCIITELREAAYYGGGGGFSWTPSEVRDRPPTFRALGCPLDRVVGRRVVFASTGLGSYGMGGYGVFGLGLALTPDLALCTTYEARVREVVKCLEARNKDEKEMMDHLSQPPKVEETEAEEPEPEPEEVAEEEEEKEVAVGEGNVERNDCEPEENGDVEDDAEPSCDEDEDEEDEEDEDDPFTKRDEEKWKEYACPHEWLAFVAFSSADYLQFEGKPYRKCGCTRFLIRDVVITDAHITDRTCRFELKRWMPEHHYLPQYALMVNQELVQKDSYTPEPATHGPHPLYALVIAQLRKEPQILLESLEADDDTLELNEKKNKKQRLPESVLSDVLAKPLGCISRVLELPAEPVEGTTKWETKESLLDAWVTTRYDLFGC